MGQLIRLNKFLSNAGIASRRQVDKYIAEGKVKVNGHPVITLGTRIDPSKDKIIFKNKLVINSSNYVYIILNKPKGVISTTRDDQGRKTILDYVDSPTRLYPVGRLDVDSEGLILLTNNGELTNQLTHPKFEKKKTYLVLVSGQVDRHKINRLISGIKLKEGITAPAKVIINRHDGENTWLKFIIHEGKHRQIRRMCTAVNLEVIRLIRTQLGPLKLSGLKTGHNRLLTPEEIKSLH